jgi:hypothetical protein
MEFVIDDIDNSMTIPPAYADALFTEHAVPVSSPAFESTAFEPTAFRVSTSTADIDEIIFSGLVIGTETMTQATGRLIGVKCVDYGYLLDCLVTQADVIISGGAAIGTLVQTIMGSTASGPITALALNNESAPWAGSAAERIELVDAEGSRHQSLYDTVAETDTISGRTSIRSALMGIIDRAYGLVADPFIYEGRAMVAYVDPERRLNVWRASRNVGTAPYVIVEAEPGSGESRAESVTIVRDHTTLNAGVYLSDNDTSMGGDNSCFWVETGETNGYMIIRDTYADNMSSNFVREINARIYLDKSGTTVRGSLSVLGTKNWRIGQQMTITNAACGLSAETVLIHAVRTDFLGGQIRRCYVEFGAIRASGARTTRTWVTRTSGGKTL